MKDWIQKLEQTPPWQIMLLVWVIWCGAGVLVADGVNARWLIFSAAIVPLLLVVLAVDRLVKPMGKTLPAACAHGLVGGGTLLYVLGAIDMANAADWFPPWFAACSLSKWLLTVHTPTVAVAVAITLAFPGWHLLRGRARSEPRQADVSTVTNG